MRDDVDVVVIWQMSCPAIRGYIVSWGTDELHSEEQFRVQVPSCSLKLNGSNTFYLDWACPAPACCLSIFFSRRPPRRHWGHGSCSRDAVTLKSKERKIFWNKCSVLWPTGSLSVTMLRINYLSSLARLTGLIPGPLVTSGPISQLEPLFTNSSH